MPNPDPTPRLLIEINPRSGSVHHHPHGLATTRTAVKQPRNNKQLSYIAELLSPEDENTAAAPAGHVAAKHSKQQQQQHELRTPRVPPPQMTPVNLDKQVHLSLEGVPRDLISHVESCFASAADAAVSQLDKPYDERVAHASHALAAFAERDSAVSQPAINEYEQQMAELSAEHAAAVKKLHRNEKKHQAKMTALMSEVQKTTATIQKRERAHEKALTALVAKHKEAVTAHLRSVQDRVAEFRVSAEKADKSKKELAEMRKSVLSLLT
ncbi:hypothetical protein HDU86_006826 [Geranomyces michiganensis]|nr:hypothetical protein HDU86_006826 [Geranomyces michiganensis]